MGISGISGRLSNVVQSYFDQLFSEIRQHFEILSLIQFQVPSWQIKRALSRSLTNKQTMCTFWRRSPLDSVESPLLQTFTAIFLAWLIFIFLSLSKSYTKQCTNLTTFSSDVLMYFQKTPCLSINLGAKINKRKERNGDIN